MARSKLYSMLTHIQSLNARIVWIVLSLILLALVVSACDETTGITDPLLMVEHEVDPAFREFYSLLGGRDVLGPAISPMFPFNNVKYQYTQSVLLVFDPASGYDQRYRLAALGLDMGIIEPAIPRPEDKQVPYIDGHIIDDLFLPLYKRLGGLRMVGRPLTEVHYNPTKGRYEQYFENLGMYWIEGDPVEEIYLLAYGVWKCDASCRHRSPENARIVLPSLTDEVFHETVTRLGADFTGFALTKAYQTPDGFLEQVYENNVLVQDPSQPGRIFLRAITEILGIKPEPLQPPIQQGGYEFHSIQGKLGYNIPQSLWEYLAKHGGIEASGPPIGEYFQWKTGVWRQCFSNICLEEHMGPDGSTRIRPSPLGYTYRLLPVLPLGEHEPLVEYPEPIDLPEESPAGYPAQDQVSIPEPTVNSTNNNPIGELSMQVWESYPMVSSDQSQEIGVSIFLDNLPLKNVEPDLIVTLPDGREKTYYLYPTGVDGQARMILEPINAANGTLIPYQICVYNLNQEKFCVRDSFLIWQNP